jgi:hypothetical protein
MCACVPIARLNQQHPAGSRMDIEKNLRVKNAASKQNTLRINSGYFI